MSSDSASFYGFALTNQHSNEKKEAPPILLVTSDENESKIKVDESKKGAIATVGQQIFFQGDLSKNNELTKVDTGVISKLNENKVKIGEDFQIDFSQVENMSISFDTIPQLYDGNSRLVTPHSTPIPQFVYNNTQPKIATQLPNKDTGLQTNGVQTQMKDTSIKGTYRTKTGHPTTQKSQTNTTVDEQTENTDLVTMMRFLCQKNDSMFNVLVTKQEEVVETQNRVETRLTKQDEHMTEMLSAVDSVDNKLTSFKTELDTCMKEIRTLQSEVTATSLQVALIQNKVDENIQVIKVIRENNDKMQIHITEKLENNLQLESKYNKINESISNMFVNLQQSRHDLEELKSKYFHLEGAMVQNREQGNHLSNRLVEITKNLISDITKSPKQIESLIYQVASPPTVNLDQVRTASHDAILNQQALPSISSSPLLSPGFFTPPITSSQPCTYQNTGVPFSTRLDGEDLIMKNIMKREKTPSFDGNNISAPQFLEELEAYFNMVNIHNDANRMKAFGSFLQGVPNGWWKRISKNIFTWEDAKNALLIQYFNDYNKERFEQEWKDWEYSKVKNAEAFALRAFNLLDIVKPDFTFKKKCQNIASKLPSPLMNYLLQKDFRDEQDFMVMLKEAMTLTNFKEGTSTVKTNGSVSSNNNSSSNNSVGTNINNHNNNSNPQNSNYNPNQVITNPNYKGKPSNFDPNYKKPNSNYNNSNGQNNNDGRRWSNGGRQWNNSNGSNGGRQWNNGNNSNQKPYYRPRGNNNGNQNQNNQQVPTSVNNVAVTQGSNQNMAPMMTSTSPGSSVPMVVIPQDTADAMTALCRQFMNLVSPSVSPPASTDEQEQENLIASNI